LDGEQSHIVQRGDTIANIAARYKVSPKNLIQRNRLASPDLIVQGKVLVIPASGASPRQSQAGKRSAVKVEEQAILPSSIPAPIPPRAKVPQEPQRENAPLPETSPAALLDGEQSHIVQKGDTIANIAACYGVSPKTLIQRNRLSSPNLIVRGTVLIIPASGR
ncbi:MAG: LysM peptidoglycan-binding domain-containing protein, partial [Betaproteobacteria bacterium]|nr:LysM peptidoglycan-binding domain-containing protein [Betaproteobacteria bacterium]